MGTRQLSLISSFLRDNTWGLALPASFEERSQPNSAPKCCGQSKFTSYLIPLALLCSTSFKCLEVMIVRKLGDGCGVIKADFPAESRWGVKPSAGCGTALKGPDRLLLPLEGSPGRGSQLHLPWWAREKQDVAGAIARSESRLSLCQKKPWRPVSIIQEFSMLESARENAGTGVGRKML